MIAALTSKGQLTLPKPIRDQLGLKAGSRIEFTIEADGSLRARALSRGAAGLFGLLHDPGRQPVSIDEMNAAVGRHVAAEDERIASPRARRRAPKS